MHVYTCVLWDDQLLYRGAHVRVSAHICVRVCDARAVVCVHACIRAVRQELGTNANRSRSISAVSSFSTVSILRFDYIRVRALCVDEPQLGCISCVCMGECIYVQVSLSTCNQPSLLVPISSLTTCSITL